MAAVEISVVSRNPVPIRSYTNVFNRIKRSTKKAVDQLKIQFEG
jgi:hypothetical protein